MKNNQSFKNILRNYFNSRTSTPNIDPMWKNMDQLLTDKNFYKVNTTTNLPNQPINQSTTKRSEPNHVPNQIRPHASGMRLLWQGV